MKFKKLFCVVSLFVVLSFISYLVFNNDKKETINNNLEQKNSNPKAFAIMLETEAGSGSYEPSTSSLWPEDGYIYNETLSRCENGGELTWHEDTRTVSLNTSGSDKCYLYFDKYVVPTINNVITSDITSDSITLTINVINGTNNIVTYYFSNNNGLSYISSTSNSYTFNGLNIGTKYTFKVYVKDSLGYNSLIYELSETTEELYYFIIRDLYNGYFYLNGEKISVQANIPVYYEIGDVLTYSHSQACSDREIIIYNNDNIIINQLSSYWDYDNESIILSGTERYIDEYVNFPCEPDPGVS